MRKKVVILPVVNDPHCIGCEYYRLLTIGKQYFCNYIFAEGKKRPCDPGKGCTVKVKRRGNKDVKC